MDFYARLDAVDKRTGESVETASAVFAGCDCKNISEFEREYAEDVGAYLRSYGLKGNYPEISFNLCLSYCAVAVNGEKVSFRGCE